MRVGGVTVGLRWYHPWRYAERIPLRMWFYSEAHDAGSFFWRICGFEINVPKDR